MSRMEIAKQAVHLFLLGIKDFFYGILHLVYFLLTNEIHQSLESVPGNRCERMIVFHTLCKSFLLGLIYWFYYIYSHVLLDQDFKEYGTFVESILKCLIYSIKLLYVPYYYLWMLLLIGACKYLNSVVYCDLVDVVFRRNGIAINTKIGIWKDRIDIPLSFVLLTFYCIQTHVLHLIPLPAIIQTLWYLVHLSFLFSLYGFEYKWSDIGWTLPRRLTTIDKKWPYFLGFGLPLASACTFGHSTMGSTVMLSALFNVHVLISAFTNANDRPDFIYRLDPFRLARYLSVVCVTLLLTKPMRVILYLFLYFIVNIILHVFFATFM